MRAHCRAFREALDASEYAALSQRIVARVKALPEYRAARTVHVYQPLLARREVDTRGLIADLAARHARIVVPVVEPDGLGERRMRHVLLVDGAATRPNRWGIEEPEAGTAVSVDALDLVVVPALGLGRDGHRLGHGMGFYDTFLAQIAAPTVGLAYGACLFDALPHEAHDVPLDVVVTEHETIRPRNLASTPAVGPPSPKTFRTP